MDPHSFSKLDPDPGPHSPKKLDPDPHKVNADLKYCCGASIVAEPRSSLLNQYSSDLPSKNQKPQR
jgi:hypothetical protein